MADVLGVIPSVGEQLDSSLWYVINASRNIAIYDKVTSGSNTIVYNVGTFKAAAISFQALYRVNVALAQIQPIIIVPNMPIFNPSFKGSNNSIVSDNSFTISSNDNQITITITISSTGSFYVTYSGIISVFE